MRKRTIEHTILEIPKKNNTRAHTHGQSHINTFTLPKHLEAVKKEQTERRKTKKNTQRIK